jgi:phosphoglycolate phosphatase
MNKEIQYVLFDFDGVIVESFDMILQAVREYNDPKLTADEFRTWSLGNVRATKHIQEDPDFHQYDMSPGTFFYTYRERLLKMKPTAGIKELIERVAQHHQLAIVSSSLSAPIQEFLVQEKLDQYFEGVYGVDVHPSKKVKLEQLFEQYGAGAEKFMFVTDTLGDIKEATEVHVPSVGVTWGFHSQTTLEEGNPYGIATTTDELSSLLKRI